MYDLSGKVALVTGAGGQFGFGRAIANRLACEGANIAVNDIVLNPYSSNSSNWAGLSQVAQEIKEQGRDCITLVNDISDSDQVNEMIKNTIEHYGKIDILINNAGSKPGPDRTLLIDLSEEAFDEVQRINVKGTFLCTKAVAKHMIERKGPGKIVNISSTAGKRGLPKYAAYTASKFALIGFTQSVAHELGQYKINVNAICPGLAETERVIHIANAMKPNKISAEDYLSTMVEKRSTANPLGRITEAEDISKMAAFLCSDQADYLTGLALTVSGGEVMY